jgi:thiol-disulfide isomerase/thioredoxin
MITLSYAATFLILGLSSLPSESAAFLQLNPHAHGRLPQQQHAPAVPVAVAAPSPSYHPTTATTTTVLRVVADVPIEKEEEKKRGGGDDEHEEDWIPSKDGGFIPNLKSRLKLRRRSSAPPSITEVTEIQDYKDVVVEEHNQLVCVRFYAPWCRACKAIQASFRRLPKKYPNVKFVEVPLTQENAYLHKGLGIPSLPFAHVYHPEAGLLEERKLNKNVFADFEKVLKTYVDGECPVGYDETGELNFF